MTDVPLREVREGRANLLVPDVDQPGGPGRKSALPFYNPSMAVTRDLVVLALAAFLPKRATLLDGLAATGVLGIRAALETGCDLAVTWNDKNPRARELIATNAERNGLTGEVLTEDLRAVLAARRFEYVDVDSFGPPVPFVDAAIQESWRGRSIGFTATDTAPLAGTYPRTCLRRYGARSLRNPCGAETALRIFLRYLACAAATHERGLRPLFAFAHGHCVKAIAAVEPSGGAADQALEMLGYVRFEGARFEISSTPPDEPFAGPLWLGPLADPAVLAAMTPGMSTGHEAASLLERLREEADLPAFFYENHSVSRSLGVDPVPLDAWIEALRAIGHRAARTAFAANGVRTNAPWSDVERTYRQAAKRG